MAYATTPFGQRRGLLGGLLDTQPQYPATYTQPPSQALPSAGAFDMSQVPSMRGLLSPEERQAALYQGLLNVGPLLMAAGAKTTDPGGSARYIAGLGPAWQGAQDSAVQDKFAGMQASDWMSSHQSAAQAAQTVEDMIAANPGMTEQEKAYARLDPVEYLKQKTKPGEPFTLGAGQVRYGPDGQPIAEGPAPEEKAPATGMIKDATGNWVMDPDYAAFMMGKATAGRNLTQITLPAAELAFEKEYGGDMATLAAAIPTNADNAAAQLGSISQMRYLVDQWRQVGGETGQLSGAEATASSLLQAVGIDPSSLGLAADAGPAQALDALTNQMTLGKIGGEGGMPANNFSDADRNFIMSTNPQLSNTPSGFEAKLLLAERMAQRAMVKDQMWGEARAAGRTYEQFRQEWAGYVNSTPLLAPQDKARIQDLQNQSLAGAPQTSSPSNVVDFNSLP